MPFFRETTHLSEIIEESGKKEVIIFKYSNDCNSSTRLYEEFQKKIENKKLTSPVYLVTVQTAPVLSGNIEEWFNVKHESPQIFILSKGKISYTAHHNDINLSDSVFK